LSDSSDSTYEGFFDLSVDMLCVAGYDGYFKRLNPAWTQTLGFTQAELMARPYLDFVHPDDRPATIAEAEKLTQGANVIQFKNQYECRDGTYRWLAWAAMPAGSGDLIHAVARDVTQEVQAEAALRAANLAAETRLALLTALIDAIGVGVVLIDRDLSTKAGQGHSTQFILPEIQSTTNWPEIWLQLFVHSGWTPTCTGIAAPTPAAPANPKVPKIGTVTVPLLDVEPLTFKVDASLSYVAAPVARAVESKARGPIAL